MRCIQRIERQTCIMLLHQFSIFWPSIPSIGFPVLNQQIKVIQVKQLTANIFQPSQQKEMKKRQRSSWHNKPESSISKIAKAYFHKIEPECESYLRAKQASIRKSKRLRQATSTRNQNASEGFMFDFLKPKLGYYALKGCNLYNLKNTLLQKDYSIENKENKEDQNQVIKGKSQFLHCFLKKHFHKKQKSSRKENSQILLPALKPSPYVYPSLETNSKSEIASTCSFSKINSQKNYIFNSDVEDKVKTQPIMPERRENKIKITSLKYIERQGDYNKFI